jgi:hypothetical protein
MDEGREQTDWREMGAHDLSASAGSRRSLGFVLGRDSLHIRQRCRRRRQDEEGSPGRAELVLAVSLASLGHLDVF